MENGLGLCRCMSFAFWGTFILLPFHFFPELVQKGTAIFFSSPVNREVRRIGGDLISLLCCMQGATLRNSEGAICFFTASCLKDKGLLTVAGAIYVSMFI